MATTNLTTTPTPSFDYSLPAAPTYTAPTPAANPYEGTADTWGRDIYNTYQSQLGRAATPQEVQYQGQQALTQGLPNVLNSITGSQEAGTYGRARNEVNPIIDSQLRGLYDQMGIEQQRTSSQLEALRPQYEAEFNQLNFGRQQNFNDLDYLRDTVMQDTDYNAQQLQSRFMPAQQLAFNTANRRGLLDSSVALGLLNQGFEPIQRGLTDLFRSSQRQLTDAERKRQTIAEKYTLDTQTLKSKQEQEARALRDQLALLIAQKQSEGNQLNQQRTAKIGARAGELGDLRFNQNIQSQTLAEQIAARVAQNNLTLQDMQMRERLANK